MICDYCNRSLETDSQGRCVNCGAQHKPQAEAAATMLRSFAAGTVLRKAYDPVSDACTVLAVGLTGQEKDR